MNTEDRAVQSLLQKISLLEKRLILAEKIQTDKQNNLMDLFSLKGMCLYFYLLGDAYLMLHNLKTQSVVSGRNVDERCLQSFESGVSTAASSLEIVDPLRLLCIYSWCNALIVISHNHRKARSVADQTFNQASLHTNKISTESVELLQRLRDDIVLCKSFPGNADDNKGAISKSEANSIDRITKPKSKSRPSTVLKAFAQELPGEVDVGAMGMVLEVTPSHRREVAQCALAVRRVVSLPVPLQLDVVSSAAVILKALDKIFRTYVRGTALPGQLSGGNTVDFDGTTLTFRNFILHGPYISWKGFVHFLLDFSVAAPPALNTRLGRAFLSEVLNGNKSRLPGGGETAGDAATATATAVAGKGEGAGEAAVAAPVTMLEAAVCFIESSKSITPALVLSKFLKMYEEMAQEIEGDPWGSVHAWAEDPTRQDWDIKSGVNFMQFVDCLGKLGLVAYKTGRYAEMLPTAGDKMEHFLSAHLGLTDQRKWHRKVESKLKKIKSVIREVGSSSSPPKRPGSASGQKN